MRGDKSKVALLTLVAVAVSLTFLGYSALAGAEDTPGEVEIPWLPRVMWTSTFNGRLPK